MDNFKTIDENHRKSVLEDIGYLRDKVSKINSEILDRFEERKQVLASIRDLSRSIGSSMYFFGFSFDELESEWNSMRFKSEKVRIAVSTIRKYLFDDSDEKFRSFFCIGLQFESFHDSGSGLVRSIEFVFTDEKNVFVVSMPSISDQDYRYIERFDEPFPENKFLGNIGVYVRANEISTELIVSSSDFDKLRKTISNLIHNFKETVDAKIKETMEKYCAFRPEYAYDQYEREPFSSYNSRSFNSDSLGDMMKAFGYFN